MTSVERIIEYTELPVEPLDKGEKVPPLNWPDQGIIKFEGVSYRYDDYLPLVLDHLTFAIHSGEKVGIVGRTGAGKSSLVHTLFRMAESATGTIHIDNVNIRHITLHALRNKIAIIPVILTLHLLYL